MKTENLTKNTQFENNTTYVFEGKKLEYFLEETLHLKNREYFCTSGNYSDEHKIAIYVKDKENIVLDFNGATLFLNGDIQPIVLDHCKNIEIKNVSIKYDRSFFTEMTLIEKGEDYLKLKIDPRFPYDIIDGRFMPKSKYWRDERMHEAYVFLQEFDPVTREGLSWPVILLGNKEKDKLELPWGGESCSLLAYQEGDYVYFRGRNIPDYKVGSILELCMNNRDISACTIFDCENVKITNFRIVNGLGMGILPMYTKNIEIDGLKMFYDEESVGIISNTADGIHADACSGDFIIKNSIITATIDDALNIHSNFMETLEANGNVIIAKRSLAAAFEKVFAAGDEIAIYKEHTMELVDNFVIKSITPIDIEKYRIEVDKEVKDFYPNSLIENMSTQPNIYIENCEFGKANTHLRFQSRGKIRVNNCKTTMDLLFTGDTNYWFESSPVQDVIIENTYFDMNKAGVVSIPEFKASPNALYYHSNITVRNCTFTHEMAGYIRFTDDIKFIDNCSLNKKPLVCVLDQCGKFHSNQEMIENRICQKGERDE